MASGILGTADVTAATNTTVYTVPASVVASFSVNFTNRTFSPVTISLAIASAATPTNAEYVIYNVLIDALSNYERTGLVAQTGKRVVVYTSIAGVSVQVYGYEGAF
jgi:hypothetical protein